MLQNDERRKREHRFLFPQLSLQTTYENHFIHFVHFTNLDKLWLLPLSLSPLSFGYNNFLFLLFVVVLNYSRMQIRPTSHAHLDVWCERAWTTQFLHERNNEKKMSNGVAQSDELNAIVLINEVCVHTIYSRLLHGLTSKHKNTILNENFPPCSVLWIFRHTIF